MVDELRVNCVVDVELRAAVTPYETGIVVPIPQHLAAKADAKALIGDLRAELRCETAGEPGIERVATGIGTDGSKRGRVRCIVDHCDNRTIADLTFQVSDENGCSPVTCEDAAASGRISEEEAAFDISETVVGPSIEFAGGTDFHAEIPEELVIRLRFRRTPYLRIRRSYAVVARSNECERVITLNASNCRFGDTGLSAQREEAVAFQGHTENPGEICSLAVAFVVLTRFELHSSNVVVFPQDHVDDARDGVGAVLSRCAVTQDFHSFQSDRGNRAEVHTLCALVHAAAQESDYCTAVATLVIQQHQRRVCRQRSQVRRTHEGRRIGNWFLTNVVRRN